MCISKQSKIINKIISNVIAASLHICRCIEIASRVLVFLTCWELFIALPILKKYSQYCPCFQYLINLHTTDQCPSVRHTSQYGVSKSKTAGWLAMLDDWLVLRWIDSTCDVYIVHLTLMVIMVIIIITMVTLVIRDILSAEGKLIKTKVRWHVIYHITRLHPPWA